MVLETEERLAKKYILGEHLEKEDEYFVDRMASIGLMHTGTHVDIDQCTSSIRFKRTAKTCEITVRLFGLRLYRDRMKMKRGLQEKYNQIRKMIVPGVR